MLRHLCYRRPRLVIHVVNFIDSKNMELVSSEVETKTRVEGNRKQAKQLLQCDVLFIFIVPLTRSPA